MEEEAECDGGPDHNVVFVEEKGLQKDKAPKESPGAVSKQRLRDGFSSSGTMRRVILGDPPKDFRQVSQGG